MGTEQMSLDDSLDSDSVSKTDGGGQSSIEKVLREFNPLEQDRDEFIELSKLEDGTFEVALSSILSDSGISTTDYVDVQVDLEGQYPMFILGKIPATQRRYASYAKQVTDTTGQPTVEIPKVRVSNLGVDPSRYSNDNPILLYPIALEGVIALLVVDYEKDYERELAKKRHEEEKPTLSVKQPAGFTLDSLSHTNDVMDVGIDLLAEALTALEPAIEDFVESTTSPEIHYRFTHPVDDDSWEGVLVEPNPWEAAAVREVLPAEVDRRAIAFAHSQAVKEVADAAGNLSVYRRYRGIYTPVITPR